MDKKIDGFEDYTVSEDGVITNTRTGHIKKPTSNHCGKGYLYVDYTNQEDEGGFLSIDLSLTLLSPIRKINHT